MSTEREQFFEPYCLNCEKTGHRTFECHSTYAINARSNEIDLLSAALPTVQGEPSAESVLTEIRTIMNGTDWPVGMGIADAVRRLVAASAQPEAPVPPAGAHPPWCSCGACSFGEKQ